MRIAIWRTEHEISVAVAKACHEGFGGNSQHAGAWDDGLIKLYDAHIGYGILRGMGDVMKACEAANKLFFHLDRGYLNPGHYDGYYRISYHGTQARWHEGIPRKLVDIKLEPIRKDDPSKPILVCPPTEYVSDFFGLDWWVEAGSDDKHVWRQKGDPSPIDWDRYRAVITFNSSVGWKALQMGIPVLSDVNHSLIGSFYKTDNLNLLLENFHAHEDNRLQVFEAMAAHQFTLSEIKQGKAWPLIKHYLSTLAGIPENQSLLQSANIPLENGLKYRFQSPTLNTGS